MADQKGQSGEDQAAGGAVNILEIKPGRHSNATLGCSLAAQLLRLLLTEQPIRKTLSIIYSSLNGVGATKEIYICIPTAAIFQYFRI